MIDFKQHFELQDRLNRAINPDWLTAGVRWSDAAMDEAMEAFNHTGWPWWKKQEPNMPQLRLELVDIWHFVLSWSLVTVPNWYKNTPGTHWPEDRITLCCGHFGIVLEQYKRAATSTNDLREGLRLFIACTAGGDMPLGTFFRLCELADLSLPELDRMYRAKGVLNLFRQANGYKDGTYVKQWAGREDNVWLDAIMATTPDATANQLMDQLSRIYHDVLSGTAPAFVPRVEAQFTLADPAELAGYSESRSDPAIVASLRDAEIGFVALDKRAARTIDILAVGSGHSSIDVKTPPFPAIDWPTCDECNTTNPHHAEKCAYCGCALTGRN